MWRWLRGSHFGRRCHAIRGRDAICSRQVSPSAPRFVPSDAQLTYCTSLRLPLLQLTSLLNPTRLSFKPSLTFPFACRNDTTPPTVSFLFLQLSIAYSPTCSYFHHYHFISFRIRNVLRFRVPKNGAPEFRTRPNSRLRDPQSLPRPR